MPNNLEYYRKLRGISRPELARIIGIDRSLIWRYENDKTRPRDQVKEKIAEILDVSVEELFFKKTVA